MKILFLIITLLLASTLPADNLIKDGSFEESKNSISRAWKLYEFEGAETIAKFEMLTKQPFSGKKSALIRRISGGSLGGIIQEKIAVKEDSNYQISAKVFTGKNTAAFVKIEFINDAGVLLGIATSKDQTFVKWGDLRFNFQTPAGTHTLKVILAMRGTSFAVFDDIKLVAAIKSKAQDWAGFAARCLPVDTVKAWSNKAVFSTFYDSPATLTFQFKGKYSTLVKPALILDLPAQLEMIEAFQQHPSWSTKLVPQITTIKHNNQNYKRYRFDNPPFFKTLLTSWGWRRMMGIAIMPTAKSQIGKLFKAYWYLENKNTKSQINSFDIKILPSLPEKKMPKDFYIGFWNGYENDFPTKDVFNKAIKKWEKSNFIGTVRLSAIKKNDEVMAKRNWKIATSSFQADQSYNFPKLPPALKKQVKDIFYSIDNKGKPYPRRMCPTFFLTNEAYTKYAQRNMTKALSRTKENELVFLDTEPWRPHTFCYCQACLKEFAKFAKLSKVPTIKEAASTKLYSKWREFRVDQCAKTIAKLVTMIRKTHPKVKIYDYDYPINYDSQKEIDIFLSRCSKDPRINEKKVDGHLSSYYHTLDKNMFDMAEINIRHLKKDYLLILAIDPPGYLAKSSVLSPNRFQVMLEGAAALGCKGIWIYSMSVVDGTMAQAAHNAMVKIAQFEEFYKQPNQPKLLRVSSSSKDMAYTIHQLNGKTLCTVLNYNYQKSISVTIKSKAAFDALTGKKLPIKDGKVVLTLTPSQSAYIYCQ